MRDPDFVAAIDAVLTDTEQLRSAVMCSETLWWRCHRRLIVEFAVLGRRVPVQHLMQQRAARSSCPDARSTVASRWIVGLRQNLDESSDSRTTTVNCYRAMVELRGQRATEAASFAPAGNARKGSESSMPDSMYQPTPEVSARRKALAPEIHEAFERFSSAVFAEGALPEKTQQLIAVAVAQVTQCPFCITGHTKLAGRKGANPDEIMEAIWVAAEMRAGGAFAHATWAINAMDPGGGHRHTTAESEK